MAVEPVRVVALQRWALCFDPAESVFRAPEVRRKVFIGEIEGAKAATAPVDQKVGPREFLCGAELVKLEGDPDPGYAEFCQKIGKPLDLADPIRASELGGGRAAGPHARQRGGAAQAAADEPDRQPARGAGDRRQRDRLRERRRDGAGPGGVVRALEELRVLQQLTPEQRQVLQLIVQREVDRLRPPAPPPRRRGAPLLIGVGLIVAGTVFEALGGRWAGVVLCELALLIVVWAGLRR